MTKVSPYLFEAKFWINGLSNNQQFGATILSEKNPKMSETHKCLLSLMECMDFGSFLLDRKQCRICTRNSLVTCIKCGIAYYCSVRCRDLDEKEHNVKCESFMSYKDDLIKLYKTQEPYRQLIKKIDYAPSFEYYIIDHKLEMEDVIYIFKYGYGHKNEMKQPTTLVESIRYYFTDLISKNCGPVRIVIYGFDVNYSAIAVLSPILDNDHSGCVKKWKNNRSIDDLLTRPGSYLIIENLYLNKELTIINKMTGNDVKVPRKARVLIRGLVHAYTYFKLNFLNRMHGTAWY